MGDIYGKHDAVRACREVGVDPEAMKQDPSMPPRFWEPNWAYMLRELNQKTNSFHEEALATPNPTSEKNDGAS